MTVGSAAPAPGCLVDATVEVRGASGAEANLDVVLGLVVDGEVTDVFRAVTGDDGIASFVVDTSSADAGAAARLEVNIAGTYADRLDLTPTAAGPCSGRPTMLTTVAEIWAPSVVVDAAVDAADGDVTQAAEMSAAEGTGDGIFLDVPTYVQRRNLSCEYASLTIATGALGAWVPEEDFVERVGWAANPHEGFRGDIDGLWGGTDDYGVYAEALVGPLAAFGFAADAFYGAGDPAALTSRLDAGTPTLVWIGLWGDTRVQEVGEDGASYALAAGEHVVVAYGYDDWGVYVSDPATGGYRSFDWATFLTMWGVLDGMGLSIAIS